MRHFALLLALTALAPASPAQNYTTAGGLRLGTEWGLTLQQRIQKKWTAEFILQSAWNSDRFTFTALGEKHSALLFRGVNLYAGAGPHFGWEEGGTEAPSTTGVFGLSLVAGGELTLGRFVVSYDLKPAIDLVGGEKPLRWQSGLSVRYVLVKGKVFRKWERKRKKRKRRKDKPRIKIFPSKKDGDRG